MSLSKEELKDLAMRYFSLQPIENSNENTEEVPVEEAKENFASAKLVDGTEVTNDVEAEFEVGQELFVIDAEGNKVAAPEGEHALESGITVVVDSEGRIEGIHRPDEEGEGDLEAAEVEEGIESIVEMEEEEGSIEEAVVAAIADIVVPELESMRAEMSSCMDRLAAAEEKMASYEEKMNAHFSATPASESKTAVTRFSKQKPNVKSMAPARNKSRYEGLLNSINK